MNAQLKNVCSVIVIAICLVGGLIFTASFAVDDYGRWPEALFSAITPAAISLVGGLSLSFVNKKNRQKMFRLFFLFIVCGLGGFGFALVSNPMSMTGVCFFGTVLWCLSGIVLIAELAMKTLQSPVSRFHNHSNFEHSDPSLN